MSALKRVPPDERFAQVSLESDDNRRRTALEIRCCKCDKTSHIVKNGSAHMPTDQAAQRFTERGWEVANQTTPGRDLCPVCKHETAAPKAAPILKAVPDPEPVVEPVAKVIEMPQANQQQTQKPTLVETPREPSVGDRRHILDKLEETYDVAEKAYKGDWSDQKIAEKLNMPRAWVEAIREQFFGPEENLATKRRLADLEAMLPQLKRLEEEHLALASKAETMHTNIRKLLGK